MPRACAQQVSLHTAHDTRAMHAGVQKPGGRAELGTQQMQQCIAAAQARHAELGEVLSAAEQHP